MKKITKQEIISNVSSLCMDANYHLDSDFLKVLEKYRDKEESPLGKDILTKIIDNDKLASKKSIPMCQDTGIVVVIAEVGNEVELDCDLTDAINAGIRKGYKDGYLRKSIVSHPLNRVNTKDNTPGIIHVKHVPGDKLKLTIAPKGGGSENMSALKMLTPAEGVEGVKKFVIDTIFNAGGKPCPPIIVGVGIGGNFEKSAMLAKEAVLRDINDKSNDKYNAKLEEELLELVNKIGVGPMGFGGSTTALAVKVNTYPCHIASLPVAINIQCHASRHKSVVI